MISTFSGECISLLCKINLIKRTVKPVLSGHSKNIKLVFKTDYRVMQVKIIAECSKGILQYFRPSLCYHLSLRSLFCLFLSGRLYFTLFKHFLIRLSANIGSFYWVKRSLTNIWSLQNHSVLIMKVLITAQHLHVYMENSCSRMSE